MAAGGITGCSDAAAQLESGTHTPNRQVAASEEAPPQPRARGAAREPRRVALLIGIADYQHFTPTGPPGKTDLQGTLNDVARVRTSLRRWGFEDGENLRVLTDARASKQGIAEGFRWLAERASDPNDVVVIYYSGHGSFAPDEDGDEALVTPGDTQDEALVPWDARDIHDPRQLVLDDHIREWLRAIRTKNVTLLIDACYSGTATRGAADAPLRRAKGPIAPTVGQGPAIEVLDHPEHTLITAASAGQIAEELPFQGENKVFGVFTYHLTRALDGAGPNARYDEVMQQVRAGVSGALVPQTPQLEGDRNARLFRIQGDVARRPYVTVTPRGTGRFHVDVGAVHGVRQSAVYDVYGPGEMQFSGPALAQIRIESVGDRQSEATALGTTRGIPAGARAVLARVPPGARTLDKLPVYLHPSAATARAAIDTSWVRLVADSTAAATHIRQAGGRVQVQVRGVPVPPASTGESEFCERMVRAFAVNAFDMIRNPQPPGALDVRVRVVESGSAPTDAVVQVDTAYIGRHYDVYAKVEAPGNSTFFLTAATVGYTGDPAVLYPSGEGMPQPFPLNTWVRMLSRVRMVEPAGLEVVKVAVNSDQFDFHSLVGSFPKCLRDRSAKGNRWQPDASAVTGWKSIDHRVVIRNP
jgi:hypothetical protein